MTDLQIGSLLERVADAAKQAGVFGRVNLGNGRLVCEAAASAEPSEYRLESDGRDLVVSLVMQDRWQSESIESDLMHSGDKLEELLDEELTDLGYDMPEGTLPSYQHFRSDDMLFTFRSVVPVQGLSAEAAVDTALKWLLAYEACFRQLGDMDAADEDD